MRFREIRTKEKITDTCVAKKEENEENEGFRQIKPETDMTVEECMAFVDSIFAGFAKEN